MIGLVILSAPIVSTLFMYGNFETHDANMTSLSLITYSLGLPAFIFLKILVTAFYSRQDIKTPVRYSLIGISINIAINITVLFFYLNDPFVGAHALVALSTSTSAWIQVILMTKKLNELGIIQDGLFLNSLSFKVVLSTIAMASVLFFSEGGILFESETSPLERVSNLISYLLIGILVYFISLRLFGTKIKDYRL